MSNVQNPSLGLTLARTSITLDEDGLLVIDSTDELLDEISGGDSGTGAACPSGAGCSGCSPTVNTPQCTTNTSNCGCGPKKNYA